MPKSCFQHIYPFNRMGLPRVLPTSLMEGSISFLWREANEDTEMLGGYVSKNSAPIGNKEEVISRKQEVGERGILPLGDV